MRLSATTLNTRNQSSADCFSTDGFGFGIRLALIVGGANDMAWIIGFCSICWLLDASPVWFGGIDIVGGLVGKNG
jgi:hypothetical protein